MEEKDIRWIQRLNNYNKALAKLNEIIDYVSINPLNDDPSLDDIVKQGLIQSFEYTHELAWKVMKDFLQDIGSLKIYGSKDATRAAFSAELILDGDIWMEMVQSRNKTSHTYNEETASELFTTIIKDYYPAFIAFQNVMKDKK